MRSGGADTITIGDLTGTDTNQVGIDLRHPVASATARSDTVIVNGTGKCRPCDRRSERPDRIGERALGPGV